MSRYLGMFVILTVPLALLVGIGSTSRWKRDEPRRFAPQTLIILASSLVLSGIFTYMLSQDKFALAGFAGLALGIWVMLWSIYSIIERLKNQSNWLQGLGKIPASFS